MKRSLILILVTFAAVVCIVSCKKNNFVVDKDPLIAPAASEFAYYNASFAKDYYVQSTGPAFKVPVGITNVSGSDRTVQFTYTSTNATNGVQFTAPTSLVIKAGQALDSLPIVGNYANLATGTAYVVKVKISGGDVPAFAGKDSVMVTIRKYCNVVLTNLAGLYPATLEQPGTGSQYGPYTTALTNATPITATSASVKLVNLYDDGWNDITAIIDWSNPANFTVTIPLQPTGKSYSASGAPTSVRTSTATGAVHSFSSCDRTLSFGIDLVNSSTGGLLATNYRFLMK
jgi:hypothetical protein